MKKRLKFTGFYFFVTVLVMFWAVGCDQPNHDEESGRTYSLQDLNGYAVTSKRGC